MNRKLVLIIALAVTMITAYGFLPMGQGQGQQGQGKRSSKAGTQRGFDRGPRMGMGIFQIKDLTDDQKDKISDIMYNHRLKSLDTKNEIEKNKIKLDQLMTADSPDKNAILNLVQQNGDLQTKLQTSRIEMMFDIKALLTPEQLEEFKSMPMPPMMGGDRPNFDGPQSPRMGQGQGPGMGMGRNQGDCPFTDPQSPPPPAQDDDSGEQE